MSAPGRYFEGKLTFNSKLVVNPCDIDENGNTDLAMGLHLMVTAESTAALYSFNLLDISHISLYILYIL